MPHLNVETRTVHAICRHFAHKREFDLDCSNLALAVQSKLPGAVTIHGTAACEGESPESCVWIRAGGKDYDVQRIAQRRRSNCASVLSRYPTPLEEPLDPTLLGWRTLEAHKNQTHAIPDEPCGHIGELEGWSLPSCAACCGKCRAHTLDSNCVSPWKADTLEIRAAKERYYSYVWKPLGS